MPEHEVRRLVAALELPDNCKEARTPMLGAVDVLDLGVDDICTGTGGPRDSFIVGGLTVVGDILDVCDMTGDNGGVESCCCLKVSSAAASLIRRFVKMSRADIALKRHFRSSMSMCLRL